MRAEMAPQLSLKGAMTLNRTSKWLTGIAGSLCVLVSPALSRADEKGAALLKEVEKATLSIKTLSGEVQTNAKFGGQTQASKGVFRIKRPNLLYAKMTGSESSTFASNGKDFIIYMPSQKQYMKMKADPKGARLGGGLLQSLFFSPTQMFGKSEPKYAGTEIVAGKSYSILVFTPTKEQMFKLYVSPEKLITIAKVEIKDEQGKLSVSDEERFTNLKVNALIPNSQFAYAPPRDAVLYKAPTQSSYDEKFLPVNSRAPEFNLATPQDGRISLENTLKEKKAVLVNFWFHG